MGYHDRRSEHVVNGAAAAAVEDGWDAGADEEQKSKPWDCREQQRKRKSRKEPA
jgi:hypothetical protein|tara:strand:+ start:231 stop:392 length:162 start_codon:yes stop_codon:yes gene_type:complete